jgi:hypothetical protein
LLHSQWLLRLVCVISCLIRPRLARRHWSPNVLV